MPKTIRQSVTVGASPAQVYGILMDSKKHARLTGGAASISRKVGGRFTAFDGYAEGVNLELQPGKKIVQSWRANDWPANHYSKATFALRKVKGGCRLTFTQTGVPNSQYGSIKRGWIDYYWTPLRERFS
ncbi:MAG TPA: SRPBCC family protein [bacterium]|jgi:activator of HSP90 ATPase|nr:SRPBCC family protein [bacterium]